MMIDACDADGDVNGDGDACMHGDNGDDDDDVHGVYDVYMVFHSTCMAWW